LLRDKSKRLLGTITASICGRRELAASHRPSQVRQYAKRPELMMMMTSVHPDGTGLVEIARNEGILTGSEEDKPQRCLDAAREFSVDLCWWSMATTCLPTPS
jgi:hypothetical protein